MSPGEIDTRRIPTDVLERDLDRMMAWGLIREYRRATRSNGRRSYLLVISDRDRVRWPVGQVYAFVRGAMIGRASVEAAAARIAARATAVEDAYKDAFDYHLETHQGGDS